MANLEYPDSKDLSILAYQAGKIMRAGPCKVENKEDGTPVTQADIAISQMVLDEIGRDFPYISVVSEEGRREIPNAEYLVLCDPIDGTEAFCRREPTATFCISVLKKGKPISAVIFEPTSQSLWCADSGKGAFLNRRKISVSSHQNLSGANVCIVWWETASFNLPGVFTQAGVLGAQRYRQSATAFFGAQVASEEFEALVTPATNGWEAAAMQLLVEEAGGKATDVFGKEMVYGPCGEIPHGQIVSNGHIHDDLVQLVASCQ